MQYKTAAAIIFAPKGTNQFQKEQVFWKVTRSRASDFFQNVVDDDSFWNYLHCNPICKDNLFLFFFKKKCSKSLQFYVVSGSEKGLKSVSYIKYTLLCLLILKTILSTMPVGPIRRGINVNWTFIANALHIMDAWYSAPTTFYSGHSND